MGRKKKIKIIVTGLSDKAQEYIDNHSIFVKDAYLVCKRSDGTITLNANMSGIEYVLDQAILMFEYILTNGKAITRVQKVVDNHVFISLETPEGKEIKWSTKDIKTYFNDLI